MYERPLFAYRWSAVVFFFLLVTRLGLVARYSKHFFFLRLLSGSCSAFCRTIAAAIFGCRRLGRSHKVSSFIFAFHAVFRRFYKVLLRSSIKIKLHTSRTFIFYKDIRVLEGYLLCLTFFCTNMQFKYCYCCIIL